MLKNYAQKNTALAAVKLAESLEGEQNIGFTAVYFQLLLWYKNSIDWILKFYKYLAKDLRTTSLRIYL